MDFSGPKGLQPSPPSPSSPFLQSRLLKKAWTHCWWAVWASLPPVIDPGVGRLHSVQQLPPPKLFQFHPPSGADYKTIKAYSPRNSARVQISPILPEFEPCLTSENQRYRMYFNVIQNRNSRMSDEEEDLDKETVGRQVSQV